MRTITRTTNPPVCLAQQSAGQDWYAFMETDCHNLVGDSLRDEQHDVCCYCELAIAEDDSHIEHLAPRSVDPGQTYDYGNLAASCNGGTVDHCGHFKDDRHRNPNSRYDVVRFCRPHDPPTSRLFRYLPNGDVAPARGLSLQEQQKAVYMIEYLGLTCSRLTGRRHAHARALIQTLGSNPADNIRQWATRYYLQPDQNGKLRSFHSLSRTILAP
jgi:uncharacterized protein (TIGR02646 family)